MRQAARKDVTNENPTSEKLGTHIRPSLGLGAKAILPAPPQGLVPTTRSEAEAKAPALSLSTAHPYFWAPFILVGEGR